MHLRTRGRQPTELRSCSSFASAENFAEIRLEKKKSKRKRKNRQEKLDTRFLNCEIIESSTHRGGTFDERRSLHHSVRALRRRLGPWQYDSTATALFPQPSSRRSQPGSSGWHILLRAARHLSTSHSESLNATPRPHPPHPPSDPPRPPLSH